MRVRQQIHLERVLLKRGGKRLPAGRVVYCQETGMSVDTGDGDKQMCDAGPQWRRDRAGRGSGSRGRAYFQVDGSVGGAERAGRRWVTGFDVDAATAGAIECA